MVIENLFPLPIGFFEFEKSFTKLEKKTLFEQKTRLNTGNSTRVDHKILDDPSLTRIKKFIEKSLKKYYEAVYSPKFSVSPYITQSWMNYTEPGQYHHKHSHSNSFISGVFYVQASEEHDRIFFYKDVYQQIKVHSEDWNQWNSEHWWFKVSTGRLILFPSSLPHMVETVKGDSTRISLAFNTFLNGYIGDDDTLTSLKYNSYDVSSVGDR